MRYEENIKTYLKMEIETLNKLEINKINSVIEILDNALKNNKKIYVFGNGGSGSTASHITSDFNKAIFKDIDNRFNFVCLNDNIPLLMAISNDICYEDIFSYQLKNHLEKDDIIVALSGSGNSKNIVKACMYAKEIGATIIGFTGYDGGKLKELSDISLDANIDNMQISEDTHLMFEHLMISNFYKIYGDGTKDE